MTLRKCVSLGAGWTDGTHPEQAFQYNTPFYGPAASGGTNTAYTRIWADWPTLQPDPNTLGQKPGPFDALDAQVQAANAAGVFVILVVRHCPSWASGVTTSDPVTPNRTAVYHIPADISITGPYAKFIQHLLLRYSGSQTPGSQGFAIWLEVCNEPNVEMWPQTDSNGNTNIGCITAVMLETAQAIHDGLNIVWPCLLGPGTSDTLGTGDPRLFTPYDVFTDQVLSVLAGAKWTAGPYTAWSHHNYSDVEQGRSGTRASNPQHFCIARDVRSRLISNGWQGWRGAPADTPPLILITEGGTRWQKLREYWSSPPPSPPLSDAQLEQIQADLLAGAQSRLQNTADGTGMAMWTNYLFYTDPTFDSGLRYTGLGGAARLAYSTWQNFPNPPG